MRKLHLTFVAAVSAFATSGCAGIQVFGWVWANQPAAASYTPDATHQYNSTGTINTVARQGTGSYVVTFPSLAINGGNVPPGQTGLNGGNVQITAQGADTAFCQTNGWQTAGATVTVQVACYQGTTPADVAFMASYQAVNEPFPDVAYTYFSLTEPSNGPSTIPFPARTSNVSSIYGATLTPIFSASVSGFAMEHVTADAPVPMFCNFEIPPRIDCWDPSGAKLDAPPAFNPNVAFSYVRGLAGVPASNLRGAYGAYDISPGDPAPIGLTREVNSFSTNHMALAHVSTGVTDLTIPGAAAGGANALVHVTAYDLGSSGGPVYCKPVVWNTLGSDIVLRVACFKMPGSAPFDDAFQVSYVVPPSP